MLVGITKHSARHCGYTIEEAGPVCRRLAINCFINHARGLLTNHFSYTRQSLLSQERFSRRTIRTVNEQGSQSLNNAHFFYLLRGRIISS